MDKVTGNALRRLSGRGAGQARRQGAQYRPHAGPGRCARVPPGRCRRGAGAPPAADARRAGVEPPFWGARVIEATPKAIVPFVNERSLYQFQWGFRKQGRSLDDFLGWAKQELRPVMRRMLALCEAEDILQPQAAYGYWKAAGQGNDLIIFEQDGSTETRPLHPAAPAEGGRRVHRRLLPRRGRCRARRDRACRWSRWARRPQRHRARLVRGQPLPGLPLSARPVGRDGRGDGGIRPQAHPRRARLRRRGRPRHGENAGAGLPRLALLVRLSGLPEARGPGADPALLGAERIGVSLSDEFQLHPEQSTSAIVVLNPHAKYFSV